jgi:hypothetical protein
VVVGRVGPGGRSSFLLVIVVVIVSVGGVCVSVVEWSVWCSGGGSGGAGSGRDFLNLLGGGTGCNSSHLALRIGRSASHLSCSFWSLLVSIVFSAVCR